MSELTLTDHEYLSLALAHARVRIAKALINDDPEDIVKALDAMQEAIDEGICWRHHGKQPGATNAQLEYRAARFLKAVPSDDEPKKGA